MQCSRMRLQLSTREIRQAVAHPELAASLHDPPPTSAYLGTSKTHLRLPSVPQAKGSRRVLRCRLWRWRMTSSSRRIEESWRCFGQRNVQCRWSRRLRSLMPCRRRWEPCGLQLLQQCPQQHPPRTNLWTAEAAARRQLGQLAQLTSEAPAQRRLRRPRRWMPRRALEDPEPPVAPCLGCAHSSRVRAVRWMLPPCCREASAAAVGAEGRPGSEVQHCNRGSHCRHKSMHRLFIGHCPW
mmetsp:Transcript_33123/g.77515  ORF Transcript_33123/g.77515 Transcript_33123/m.77515 type:complete len:239 (-) Transcript_33123:204-920(-)